MKRSDCILVYGCTTKGDIVKRSDCTYILDTGGLDLGELTMNPGMYVSLSWAGLWNRYHR